ncbi:hypothetical protein E6O75_ATG06849 [Venturia nashicola]|uniref:THO complex subunit 2 n=1 Tax=Venturia nashicola TaxID=86259 RepID=A0A4Z1PDY2_9PEZI|nr:hypothetical protein E6O75_ATG06849 [Venturia nashicola]
MAPPKRRRPQDDDPRPNRNSPHRPQNMNLAQQNQQMSYGSGNRGGRRSSRGGGGGRNGQHSQPQSPTTAPHDQQSTVANPAASNSMAAPAPAPVQPPARAQNVPTQAQRPIESPAPIAPKPNTPPYHYQYLNEERLKAWKSSGRQAVIDDALKEQEKEDCITLSVIFQELLQAAFNGLVNRDDAGTVVKEVLEKSSKKELLDLDCLFLDTFSIFADVESQATAVLQPFLLATGISPSLLREVLDAAPLQTLSLVRGTFDRMGIRHSTNVLYRQSAYNLLREETEGYSKLMTEYFTVTANFKPTNEVVKETYEKVKALIGAFDLDVGRVLDVTLDAFANSLVRYNKFYTKFLRISAWWPQEKVVPGFTRERDDCGTLPPWARPDYPTLDTTPEDLQKVEAHKLERDVRFWKRVEEIGLAAFYELGGRRVLNNKEMNGALEAASEDDEGKEKDTKGESVREWIKATGTFPPSGNDTAAQILGFKLRFYASPARDKDDTLPETLIWLTALLIKIGFISIRDLYPHLYPADEDMEAIKEKLVKEKEERDRKRRPGGGTNALTMAGALPDEGPGGRPVRDLDSWSLPLRADTAASKGSSTPARPEPDNSDTLPEPADQKILLLKSLLMVGAIPEALFILGKFPWLLDLHPDLPQYLHRILHHSLSKIADEMRPVSQHPLLRQPQKRMSSVSPSGSVSFEDREPLREMKYAQMEKIDWAEGVKYRFYWQEWADNIPVCQTVDDVFGLCSTLLNLAGVKIGQDPALMTLLARVGKKNLQENSSPENHERWFNLAKRLLVPALSLTKLNPAVVNEVFELIKFFPLDKRYNIYAEWFNGQTSRNSDIKDAFEQTRAETKDVLKRISKTNTREMARAFAKISYASPGVVFAVMLSQIESYANLIDIVVECSRYLTFLGYEVLIWSLLQALSGAGRGRVQSDGMLTSSWLKALSKFAGKALKRYKSLDPMPVLRYVNAQLQKGNSTDLEVLEELVENMAGIKPDTNWSEEQCLAMAGRPLLQSQTLKTLADTRHLSQPASNRLMHALTRSGLAGQLLVAIARERQNYMDKAVEEGAPVKVMSRNLSKIQDAFVQYLDMLRFLLPTHEFDKQVPSLAELLSRYGIDVSVAFAICRPSIQHLMEESDKVEDAAKAAEKKEPSPSTTGAAAPTNGDVEMADAAGNQDPTASKTNGVNGTQSKDVEMKESSQPATPSSSGELSKSSVSIHPVLRNLMDSLKNTLSEEQLDSMSLSFYVRFWQLSLGDLMAPRYEVEINKIREQIKGLSSGRDKARLQKVETGLGAEAAKHMKHVMVVRKNIIAGERKIWFADFPPEKQDALMDAIIQECFVPRLTLSPIDATFTARFIFWVHKMGTPGFKTRYVLDRLLRAGTLRSLLFMWTEKEAKNFSVFLNEVLKELRFWHSKSEVFEKEALGPQKDFPGFATELREDGMGKTHIDFEEFRRDLFKWHGEISLAFKELLKSDEFMRIRNTFQVLQGIHTQFPALNFHGKAILENVTTLSKEDPREDIKLSASSLLANIQRLQKDWLPVQAFRKNDSSDAAANGTATKATGTPGNNGTHAEDGEIDDSKVANNSALASQVAPATANANHLRPESARGDRTRTPDVQSARPAPSQLKPDVPPFTPSAAASSNVPRPDLNRSNSSNNLPPVRPPHNLPARPNGPIPGRERLSHRPEPPRPDSRSGETYGRLDRPTDVPRPVDALPKDLFRDRSPGARSRGRTPEGHRDRRDPGHVPLDRPRDPRDIRDPRDVRDPRDLRDVGGPRDPRDLRDPRDYPDNRDPRGRGSAPFPRDPRDEREREWDSRGGGRGRGAADSRGPPPPFDPRERDRQHPPLPPAVRAQDVVSPRDTPPVARPAINPERARLMQDRPEPAGPPVNPERAQLIDQGDRRQNDRQATLKSKLEKERQEMQNRDLRNARPPSPRRDERSSVGGGRGASHRDERERDAPPERSAAILNNKDRRDEPSGPPPSAPRVDRLVQEGQGSGRGREVFNQSAPPSRPPQDPNHGRLSQANQDPNYGRLNAAPNETPLGPRGGRVNGQARGGGGRNFTAPAPSGPRNMDSAAPLVVPSSPSHDRAPPTGPAAAPPASAPHGPAADQASIHPSRRGNLPPTLHTSIPAGPASQGHNATSPFTPQGPRGGGGRPAPSTGNMAAPSPTVRYPAGPGMGQRGNRLMQNITGTLRQANEETGPMIRGRASTGRLGGSQQQQSAPQSPVISQPTSNPSSRQDAQPSYVDSKGRPDLMADRMSKVAAEGNDAPSPSGGGGHDDRSDSKGGRQRSGRHESERSSRRHRSRSRSPRRDSSDKPPRRDEPARSSTDDRRDRDKAGSDRDRERDPHSSSGRRRGGHNDHEREREPRESRGGERDSRHGDSRRSDRPRDEPRGGPPRTDEPPLRRGTAIWDGNGPRPPTPPPPPPPPNGDSRGGRGGDRKDDRDRRDGGGRDRKRNRGGGEGDGPDSKRRRGP